jgi:hypothetical protein
MNMSRDTHLDDAELAALIDGGLEAETRTRVEAHLVACAECRALLAWTGRSMAESRPRVRRVLMPVGLATAAVLSLLLLRPGTNPQPDLTRDIDASAAATTFAANAPAEGAEIRLDTLIFRWTAAGAGATYQLTLSAQSGAIIWTARTTTTSLALPDSVWRRVDSGRVHYWQVDALLPNLRSASTGQRRLIPIAP